MLITWSRHGRADVAQASPKKLVGYFNAPAWRKTIGERSILAPRDPAPEVLIGDARRFSIAAHALPFRRQYASAVLSFAHGDIDVTAFNAGAPAARQAAGIALHLVLETVLAGLPLIRRPPLHATTHTHTGRLEINLAIGCGILDARGELRSFNPMPPLKGHRNGLDACRDTLNAMFEWADPQDPLRQRLIARPDWQTKAMREAQRARIAPPVSPREDLLQDLTAVMVEHDPKSRHDVLHAIAAAAPHTGYIVIRTTRTSITLASPEAPDHDITFHGRLFAKNFSGFPDEAGIAQARRDRACAMKHAPERLREAISRHAAYNADRYGHATDPGAADRLDRLLQADRDLPCLIPACHPAWLTPPSIRPVSPAKRSPHVTQPHPTRTPSAGTAPVDRETHRGTPADPRPRPVDAADAAGRIADLRHAADRLARSAPAGSRAELTARLAKVLRDNAIISRLRWCVTPAGEGIDIQTEPATLAVWVPGAGLWSNVATQGQTLYAILCAAFPTDTAGSLHLTQNPPDLGMTAATHGPSP